MADDDIRNTSEGTRVYSIGAKKSKADIDSDQRMADAQDTRGLAARAAAAKPQIEETDPNKMAPLAKAAYLAKKKRESQASVVEKP